MALPQQARVLVRDRPRERRADLRLPRAGLVGGHRARRGLPAAVRARQRGPAPGPGLGARAGPHRLRPPHADRRAAQPRHPRGPAHRRDPGAAGGERGRRGRGRVAQRRGPGRLAAGHRDRHGRRDHGGRFDLARRRRRDDHRGARRPDLPPRRPVVLPDEHRDGREALRGDRRRRQAPGLGARLRPVLRHRHDRPVAGVALRRDLGPGDRRGGDRQRPGQRQGQ